MAETTTRQPVQVAVRDLDEAIRFYTRCLGLVPERREGRSVELTGGERAVRLQERVDRDPKALSDAWRGPGLVIALEVEDVDAAWRELAAAGVPSACPPTDRPWGYRTAFVRDPDEHLVELAAPLRPDDPPSAGPPSAGWARM